jgi:lysophospholipase L1-like esterase
VQRFVARGIVVGVALLLGIVLAELMLRLAAPQVTMFPRYVISADYEIEMARSAEIRHGRGRLWNFTYRTNEIGRRGAYIAPDQLTGKAVVTVLGDSFSFGIGVEDDEVFPAQLGRELGGGWHVVNGGMSGWGLDSQIKWYYAVGARYQPEVVVLQFTANDPWDSGTGVTTVGDDGVFAFHPYASDKPAWQQWVSRSGLLQRSHLFSLFRSVQSGGGATADVADPEALAAAGQVQREVQERYIALLDAFAARLAAEGTSLHVVSVTHREDGAYIYDVDNYPMIADSMERLEEAGLLSFVRLPLDRMETMSGSPEGHQWGPDHHRAVAETLAESLAER